MPNYCRTYGASAYYFTVVTCNRIPILTCEKARARDWPWSSFHRYVREGYYDEDWGRASEWWGKEGLGE